MFENIITFIRELYPQADFIPLHAPVFKGRERQYLMEAIDSTFVSSVGLFVDRFEQMMCEQTGATHAIATVNGTCGLHTALVVAGVQPGDEVITQPLSFVATANAIAHCGAKPVFVDVDSDTLGLSPQALKKFMDSETHLKNHRLVNKHTGRKISGCVPMHSFGHPCEIDEIVQICQSFGIPVVEDAAEALGSQFKGKPVGTFGDMGVFSFNGNKTITAGGGGAIVTNHADHARLLKHITTTAKIDHPYEYDHDRIGYNYRMPNINAALAVGQMEMLDDFIAFKRVLAEKYRQFFQAGRIQFIGEPQASRSNYWLNAILFEDQQTRTLFLETAHQNRIGARPAWKLLNELPMYQDCYQTSLPIARKLQARLVNLPSGLPA